LGENNRFEVVSTKNVGWKNVLWNS